MQAREALLRAEAATLMAHAAELEKQLSDSHRAFDEKQLAAEQLAVAGREAALAAAQQEVGAARAHGLRCTPVFLHTESRLYCSMYSSSSIPLRQSFGNMTVPPVWLVGVRLATYSWHSLHACSKP